MFCQKGEPHDVSVALGSAADPVVQPEAKKPKRAANRSVINPNRRKRKYAKLRAPAFYFCVSLAVTVRLSDSYFDTTSTAQSLKHCVLPFTSRPFDILNMLLMFVILIMQK